MSAELVVKGTAAAAIVALFSIHAALCFLIVSAVAHQDPVTVMVVAGIVFYCACRSFVASLDKLLEFAFKQGGKS